LGLTPNREDHRDGAGRKSHCVSKSRFCKLQKREPIDCLEGMPGNAPGSLQPEAGQAPTHECRTQNAHLGRNLKLIGAVKHPLARRCTLVPSARLSFYAVGFWRCFARYGVSLESSGQNRAITRVIYSLAKTQNNSSLRNNVKLERWVCTAEPLPIKPLGEPAKLRSHDDSKVREDSSCYLDGKAVSSDASSRRLRDM
jgi:hypothetical protein